jgi:hypothetical protein
MLKDKMKLLLLILLFVCGSAFAQNSLNLAIPQSPQSFQQDRIRAGDIECSAAIGSSTNVEFGVVGLLNQNDPLNNQMFVDPATGQYSNQFVRDVGVYGRINIPIGAPKERLNCNLLYKLELERRKLEVMKLRQEIAQLKRLKFEE